MFFLPGSESTVRAVGIEEDKRFSLSTGLVLPQLCFMTYSEASREILALRFRVVNILLDTPEPKNLKTKP